MWSQVRRKNMSDNYDLFIVLQLKCPAGFVEYEFFFKHKLSLSKNNGSSAVGNLLSKNFAIDFVKYSSIHYDTHRKLTVCSRMSSKMKVDKNHLRI